MAFELSPNNIPAEVRYKTGGDIVLEGGTRFQIRRLGPTLNYADWVVPVGKKWVIVVNVEITEADE